LTAAWPAAPIEVTTLLTSAEVALTVFAEVKSDGSSQWC